MPPLIDISDLLVLPGQAALLPLNVRDESRLDASVSCAGEEGR